MILSFLSSDQHLPHIDSINFDPHKFDITRYHLAFFKGQAWSLTCQLHCSILHNQHSRWQIATLVTEKPQLHSPNGKPRRRNGTIDFLVRASYSIFRDGLRSAILIHPKWDVNEAFIFSLYHKNFLSPGQITKMHWSWMLQCIESSRRFTMGKPNTSHWGSNCISSQFIKHP